MRLLALIALGFLTACGSAETASPESTETAESHFLSEQEAALEKARKTKDAIEKAAGRTKGIVDDTIEKQD